jgi:hypothetical protein
LAFKFGQPTIVLLPKKGIFPDDGGDFYVFAYQERMPDMTTSTVMARLLASPFGTTLRLLVVELLPLLLKIAQRIVAYRVNDITPAATSAFEKDLADLLREVGRVSIGWTYNRLEAEREDEAPALAGWDGELYRRRSRSRRRYGVATLFGNITLYRIGYETVDADSGLRNIFPLEMRLGVTAGRATPALMERVGRASAQHTQKTVLEWLKQDHNVQWSAETLRKVTASLSAALAPSRHKAQVQQVLTWLKTASDSSGSHKPVLSAGRDGVFVPMRGSKEYREASTATLTVLNRRGQRVGTVYVGHMPESGQTTLSAHLTALLNDVLMRWQGPLPRLEYVTDGGHHPAEYFDEVLRSMVHPRTGSALEWQQVLDFYHACGYVTKMAEALFGAGTQQAKSWSAKMRRWLRDKQHGIFRVLHSAAAHRSGWELTKAEEEAYDAAYNYLRKRMPLMDYVGYRRHGLAIGSGVTEAACKTLFTQRFKQSGMKWSWEGGQVIVELRAIWLSGIWTEVYTTHLAGLPLPVMGTKRQIQENTLQMAA